MRHPHLTRPLRRTALHQAISAHRWKVASALVGMAMLQSPAAIAADECGALAPGGTVTCAATPDPYAGIDYQGVQDGTVVLGEGTQV